MGIDDADLNIDVLEKKTKQIKVRQQQQQRACTSRVDDATLRR